MRYVDGSVLTVPKKNLAAYVRLAQKAGKIWREHGALEYRECAGDDPTVKMGVSFPRLAKARVEGSNLFSRSNFSITSSQRISTFSTP